MASPTPIAQPGSRAGLITALVVFVLLFFIAAIFAVVKSNDEKAQAQRLEQLQKGYDEIVSRIELSAARDMVGKLREDPANQRRTLYDILTRDRDELARTITGQPGQKTREAIDGANAAVASAAKQLQPLNVAVPAGALTSAIGVLADAIVQRNSQVNDASQRLLATNEQLKKQIEAYQKELQTHKAAADAARAEALAAGQREEKYRQDKDAQISTLEKNLAETIEKGRQTASELDAQIKTHLAKLDELAKEIKKLKEKIVFLTRPTDLGVSILRQPDGKIIQVDRNNIVYINLGQGQRIYRGMTFEVYDKQEGIPRMGDETTLPVGKASIEVASVGPGSSECRVIRIMAGQQITEGDIIANLVYDPNIKWSFMIYGDFDIDQNGQATPAEAEILRRLVVEWGGRIVDKVDIDTDFVIMGREPTLPPYTKQEREQEPLKDHEYKKAEAALKAYDDVRNHALDLHIPVLSQNRFLYLIGYYDQAKK